MCSCKTRVITATIILFSFKVFLYHLKNEIHILQQTKWHRLKNVYNLNFEPEVDSDSSSNDSDDVDDDIPHVSDDIPHVFDDDMSDTSRTELQFPTAENTSSDDELETLAHQPDGCSSLFLLTSDVSVMAHNEDVSRELQATGAFVEAHVYPDPNASHKESFYALTLPGEHNYIAVYYYRHVHVRKLLS